MAEIRYAVNNFRCVTYFVISLDSTILLSSFTISGPTHTRVGRELEDGTGGG